jgi:hypothetical protein
MGISGYPGQYKLKNSTNDADDMAKELVNLGFSTVKLIDAKYEDADHALRSFKDALNSNDIGLFYFAGHGIQIDGQNYLGTIDTNFHDEVSVKHSSLALNQVIDIMDSCSNRTNFIILDACRNNTYTPAWNRGSGQDGLAPVYTPRGTLIAFATSPGETAADGKGRNGTYTESILKHINTQDVSVEDLFKRVRNTLYAATSGKQTSWEHTSLSGDFFFNISLGRSVSIYKPESVSDSLYTLRPGDVIDDIIQSLKSLDWYTQNPAIQKLTPDAINSGTNDSLFVLGRNIYQASCGSANSAVNYIDHFQSKMKNVEKSKAKCILDGILFEIFFNSSGEIRKDFKSSNFNLAFSLKSLSQFSESFDFIAETMLSYQSRFYVIPGKNHSVTIDILSSENDEGEHMIEEIHFESFNILRKDDDSLIYDFGPSATKLNKLKRLLSEEMVIPENQLTLVSSLEEGDKILYPHGVSVGK